MVGPSVFPDTQVISEWLVLQYFQIHGSLNWWVLQYFQIHGFSEWLVLQYFQIHRGKSARKFENSKFWRKIGIFRKVPSTISNSPKFKLLAKIQKSGFLAKKSNSSLLSPLGGLFILIEVAKRAKFSYHCGGKSSQLRMSLSRSIHVLYRCPGFSHLQKLVVWAVKNLAA